MNVGFWIRHPLLLARRLPYWLWERANPDLPWMCPGTIRFCAARLDKSQRGLEFGSGRSTTWFAGLLGHLTSVEHNEGWHRQVRDKLAAGGIANTDYRHVALEHPEADPEREAYDPVPAYVRVADEFADKSLDWVIVDGHYRTQCVRRCVPKLKPGGHLLLDDAHRWPSPQSVPVPREWRIVDDSSNGLKRCIVWQAT